MALSYAFGGNTGQSYDELQRRRMFAESLMQRGMSSQPKTAIEGLNSAASSIMGALLQKKLGAQDAANRQKATQAALDIFGRPAPDVIPPNPGISTPRNPNDPVQIGNDTMAALGKTPSGWDGIKAGIFAGESGGDYNALFGFQNRPGGAFSNVQLTGMSVDDALKFADPNGQYGQHVKGQIGRVATPMGAYQVVGTTLAAAKKGLGLRGDEIMTPALQDRIGQWIYQNQGTGAWEGYKGPQQPQGGMDPQILMAMSDPNLPPEMKSALGVLLQQRIAAAQPPDPMAALELEKTKLEVDKLKNPAPPESVTTRLMLAKQAGLQPGTPEYSTYMATGELPKPQEPAKPIEINNKLVDPTTGKVIGDYGTPDPGFRMLTPEEAAAMRLPQGAYQIGPDNKISEIGGDGASVTVDMGGGSNKQVFDAMDARSSLAQSSYNALTALNNAEAAVDGGIINGAGANQILGLKKVASAMGMDDSQIVNTETFVAAMAPVVAATLKATAGTANLSNADMEFAKKAAAGDITLDSRSIKRLIGILRASNEAVVKSFNGKLDKVYPDDGKGTYSRERAMFGLGEIPMYTPPAPPAGTASYRYNSATGKIELVQ